MPYPLNSGGNQAFFNMVEYVRHRMAVSLLLYPKSEAALVDIESLRGLWPNVTFYIYYKYEDKPKVKHPRYKKWSTKVRRWFNIKTYTPLSSSKNNLHTNFPKEENDFARKNSTLFRSYNIIPDSDYCKYVQMIVKEGFDIVQVEFYELISLSFWLPEDVQTVFVHHEIRYIRNECEMKLFQEINEEDRALFRMAKGFELAALRFYKHILTLTEIDCRLLMDCIGNNTHVYASPAVVLISDKDKFMVNITNYRLTFVGSEDHYPNLDAVAWFCHEIAPYLRERGFHFVFQVIGVWRSDYVKELQLLCPEMELVGYVEDLHTYLNGSIMLVPIRIGSGMRMKILDAVSSMTPFVTTTKGSEGIDLCKGIDYLIGDTAFDFADAIIKLASDSELQVSLAIHAAESLRKLYNPKKMLEHRMAAYEQILGCKL